MNEQPRPAWDQEMRRAGLAALRRIAQGGPDQDGNVMPPARAQQVLAGWMLECMARLDALEAADQATNPAPTTPYREPAAGPEAPAGPGLDHELVRALIHHELAQAWDQGWQAGWKQAGGHYPPAAGPAPNPYRGA